jgi:hypothetical protein
MAEDKPTRADLCGKWFVPLKKVDGSTVRYMVAPVKCKTWDCPECRKKKAKDYISRIQKMFDGRRLWMVTLTYKHDVSEEYLWKNYNDAWNRLRTNLFKQFGKFSFVRVLESHNKSDYPHLHLIWDRKIPVNVFGPATVAAGFGYQMELTEITSDRARTYIAKYLTKEWKNEEGRALEKKCRCRRISFSRDLDGGKRGKSGFECLGFPDSFEKCRECIDVDQRFDAGHRYTEGRVRDFADFYEIEFEIDDVPPGYYRRTDLDDWQPDDWVPK